MPKKTTEPFRRLTLNDDLEIIIDHKGDIYECHPGEKENEGKTLEITAKHLDQLVELSSSVAELYKQADGIAAETATSLHPISFSGQSENLLPLDLDLDGDIYVGCALITGEQVKRVHKISLAMRGRGKK